MDKKNINWLASYPKSGNTWFRSFLTSLFNSAEVDINDLTEGNIFSVRSTFEEVMDVDSTLFSDNEQNLMHSRVYQFLSNQSDTDLFFKIHNAYLFDQLNNPVVPNEATKSAIYFVRNPFDVVISFSNHNNKSIQKTIEDIKNEKLALSTEQGRQFVQPLLSWSNHFKSWTTKPNFPVYIVRYEDMLSDTFNVFKGIIQKIGLEYSDNAIKKAIESTSFEKLKKQENEKGFIEKNPDSPRFFNNGKSGTWHGKLTNDQINEIISVHGDVMKELGYL